MRPRFSLPMTLARLERHPWATAALLVTVGVLLAGVALWTGSPAPVTRGNPPIAVSSWTLDQLAQHARAGDVGSISTEGDAGSPRGLLATTVDGGRVPVTLSMSVPDAVRALSEMGLGSLLTVNAATVGGGSGSEPPSDTGPAAMLLLVLLATALVVLVAMAVHRTVSRRSGRDSRGATFTTVLPGTRRGDSARSVRLEDVAGCDEAKVELVETIEFLRDASRFQRLGASSPRGVLLWGPPGTGKTMLARAVATEAGVPFLAASGSQFVEKYVGVGASRVRKLFAQARRYGSAVLFIDEFDALAKARGGVNSHEEREQTLNQLLVEMDGFGTTDQLVVIAATNRFDTLDPAVVRPGRFTRKIHVGLPDVVARRAILEIHARKKPLASDVDLPDLARRSAGFSGAALADVLNEAAILAGRRSAEAISLEDVRGGWLKVAVGTSRVRSMDERERAIIAAHEAGHAICGRVWGEKRRIEEISLFAHGEALGVTVSSQEDNDLPAESDLRATLVALMGGRAAEEILFEEVTAGASNDFEQADSLATRMVTRWGMGSDPEASSPGVSGRGPMSFRVARDDAALPTDVAAAMSRAVGNLLDDAYADAKRTLLREMDRLRRVSAYLVEHERIDGDAFGELFDGTRLPAEGPEWRPVAARPRSWEQVAAIVVAPRSTTAGPRPPRPTQLEPRQEAGRPARLRQRRRLPRVAWAPAALLRRLSPPDRPDAGTA
jgi:cell division protease FtsH